MGKFTKPTKASTAQGRPSFPFSSSAFLSAMIPRYSNNRTKVDVSLASHTHQVPHVGFPQIAPVIRTRNASDAPMGAILFAAQSANLIFHIRKTALEIAIIK